MTLKRFWISLGAGVLLGIVLIQFDAKLPRLTPGRLAHFVIALWISVVLHEAGHAVGGVWAGFRLLVFAVKPFKLYRKRGAWRLGWLEKTRFSGFVAGVPDGTIRLRERTITFIAGGPISSLLAGGAALALAVATRRSLPEWSNTQLNMIGGCSLFLALVNSIPRANGQFVTDGQRLRILLRRGAESERYCMILLLVTASHGGLRPRDWDTNLMERLSAPADGSPDGRAAQALRYNWLIDSRRIDEAEATLQEVLSQELPHETAGIWHLEAAWFAAKYRGDLEEARRWLGTASSAKLRSAGYRCALAKAKAAISALEQDWPAVESAALETFRQCELLNDAGTALAIGDAVRELLGSGRPTLES